MTTENQPQSHNSDNTIQKAFEPSKDIEAYAISIKKAKIKNIANQQTLVNLAAELEKDFSRMIPEDFAAMTDLIQELAIKFSDRAEAKIREEMDCVNQLAEKEARGYVEAGNEAVYLATGRDRI